MQKRLRCIGLLGRKQRIIRVLTVGMSLINRHRFVGDANLLWNMLQKQRIDKINEQNMALEKAIKFFEDSISNAAKGTVNQEGVQKCHAWRI